MFGCGGDDATGDAGPTDAQTAPEDAGADGAVAEDAGTDGAVPTYCGDDGDVPCCPDAWIIESEGPEIQLPTSLVEPADEGAVLWQGIEALEEEPCESWGSAQCTLTSVLSTSVDGAPQAQRSTLAPDSLAWLAVDTPLTLAAGGTVALDEDGALVWAILNASESGSEEAAVSEWHDALPDGWSVTVQEAPYCRRFSAACWLYDFSRLEFEAPGADPTVLDPGESAEVTVGAMRYGIRNSAVTTRNSELLPDQCADTRFGWSWEIVALGPAA